MDTTIRFKAIDTIMALHYASWFYMTKDFDNSDRLSKSLPIQVSIESFEEISYDGIEYLFKDGFGIAKSIVYYLSGDLTSEIPDFKSLSNDEYGVFSDGTIIKKNAVESMFRISLEDIIKKLT